MKFKNIDWSFILLVVVLPVLFLTISRLLTEDEEQPNVPAVVACKDAGSEQVKSLEKIPAVIQEELSSIEARTSILDTGFTRLNNIEVAADHLDEKILTPGEYFSFNDVVGIRTLERGFMAAPSQFFGGTRNTVGGGICQVSTTLYQALMKGGFDIQSAHNHSQKVDYAELGLDAAVSWGGKDLTFFAPVWMKLRVVVEVRDAGASELVVFIDTREPRQLWESEWVHRSKLDWDRVNISSKYVEKSRKVRNGEPGVSGYRRWELEGSNCGAALGSNSRKCLRLVHREYSPVDEVFVVPSSE